ncbi:MAG: glycosyltransferase family 4 protein [bacterium]|nr:glycosyltransferase family 4 protein [bacterium]
MKIIGVYGEDYPWDVRVEKLLRGCLDAGHQVRLVCRNLERRALVEDVDGIGCHRVLGPDVPGPLNGLLSLPAPANPVWRRAIRRACRDFTPDLLIVRDLPLALLVIQEAERLGVSALVDMAENHPAMWQNVVDSDPIRLRSLLLKNPALARRLERRVAARAAGIFVVVDEMRDHLLELGAPRDRVHIVSNTPPRTTLDHVADPADDSSGTVDLIYVGLVTRNRGLDQVVAALAALPADAPPLRFHVVGAGGHLPRLKALSRELGATDRVVFHGWVDSKEVPSLVAKCHVGVIPHLKTEHTDTTVPNKLFDFMAAGLPVIVSNAVPMQRIVEEQGCGLAFDGEVSTSLPDCLGRMSDPVLRRDMGKRGRRAVSDIYTWERDLDRALEVIGKLGGASAPRPVE